MADRTLDSYRQWATVPLNGTPDYSVVIPTCDDQLHIAPAVGAVASHLCTVDGTWELIVADGGSTDDTVKLVRQLDLANLRIVTVPDGERPGSPRGRAAALRAAVAAADGPLILTTPVDQAIPVEQFMLFVDRVRRGDEVVVGTRTGDDWRFDGDRPTTPPGRPASRLQRAVLGRTFLDPGCGFAVYTAAAARLLFPASRMGHDAMGLELLHLAHRHGLRVAEVPVAWTGAAAEAARSVGPSNLNVVRIRINTMLGRYRSAAERRPGERPATPAAGPEPATRSS